MARLNILKTTYSEKMFKHWIIYNCESTFHSKLVNILTARQCTWHGTKKEQELTNEIYAQTKCRNQDSGFTRIFECTENGLPYIKKGLFSRLKKKRLRKIAMGQKTHKERNKQTTLLVNMQAWLVEKITELSYHNHGNDIWIS